MLCSRVLMYCSSVIGTRSASEEEVEDCFVDIMVSVNGTLLRHQAIQFAIL